MLYNSNKYPTALLELGLDSNDYLNLEKIALKNNAKLFSIENSDEEHIFKAIEALSSYACLLFISSHMLDNYSREFFIKLGNYLPLVLLKGKNLHTDISISSPFSNIISLSANFDILDKEIQNCLAYYTKRAKLLYMTNKERAINDSYVQIKSENVLLHEAYNEKRKCYDFLSNFITHTHLSSNIQELFLSTSQALENLFELQSMHIAFWNKDFSNMHYYLGIKDNDISSRIAWKKFLNSIVKPLLCKEQFIPYQIENILLRDIEFEIENKEALLEDSFILSPCHVHIINNNFETSNPKNGFITNLPLIIHDTLHGSLVLQLKQEKNLSEDTRKSLELACSHFTLLFYSFFSQENGHKESFFDIKRIADSTPLLRQ